MEGVIGTHVVTPEIARERMCAWASGRLSHANEFMELASVSQCGLDVQVAIAQADAAETMKWAAVYAALKGEE